MKEKRDEETLSESGSALTLFPAVVPLSLHKRGGEGNEKRLIVTTRHLSDE